MRGVCQIHVKKYSSLRMEFVLHSYSTIVNDDECFALVIVHSATSSVQITLAKIKGSSVMAVGVQNLVKT